MRTVLGEIAKRLTPWNKSIDVYGNDIDNAYPERMDRLINNSVTAKSAANIMVQYLIGKGYGTDNDNLIVNKQHTISLIDFADDVAEDLVKQRGVFIHINYNALYEIVDVRVMPNEWCRKGKSDSNAYSGKIAVYEDWSKPKKSDIKLIDVFNPNPKVIQAQVEKAGGWEKYKGQIWFVNMDTKLHYPLSRVDSVAEDCDSEAQTAVFKNRMLRRGFFGNMLVVTKPLISKDIPRYLDANERKINPEWIDADDERKQFQNAIVSSLGAENGGGVLCVEMEFGGDKLEESILFQKVESNIDDKIFAHTETSVRENILIAFNNLPAGLIKTSDSQMFGNSGESIREMKRTYWENTSKERNKLTYVLNSLLSLSVNNKDLKVQPIKLIDDTNIDNP
ncbi:hypothetical protein Q765_03315 [Flavobacterium rivuli WB 3.3-2 = DSM 21788]|uniref:Phage portal protein n=1 Tax=Flavobacterium rivuli WB 3.3-2 = DSM 21788 TaxID=1121895 RepID=A0A0A2M607_9FLAO|nr:hypothetical protein [Flavobacterium rivuli]KGO88097.1 hypothetical protein Q765_03315 [Flavobacterium rivuli WB 3.3-2 = DSM 21788]